jgi:hypothetical protein
METQRTPEMTSQMTTSELRSQRQHLKLQLAHTTNQNDRTELIAAIRQCDDLLDQKTTTAYQAAGLR